MLNLRIARLAALVLMGISRLGAAPDTPTPDSLGRESPRSAVTGFLEACRSEDYQTASQYLDLRRLSPAYRDQHGLGLAKQLEAILNADRQFNILRLSRNPEGDLTDDGDPNREHVTTISQNGQEFTLDLQRIALQSGGPQVWLFSRDTVAAIPNIHAAASPAAVERYLPSFLVSDQVLETSLWKWLALIVLTLLMISLSRLLDWLLTLLIQLPEKYLNRKWRVRWLEAIIQPLRVIFCLAIFRIGVEIVEPSVIARLYIGRCIEIIFVWSIAWCTIRLVELFMDHLELRFDSSQQIASRTMLHLGRRTANVMIVLFAILLILQTWGYNTSTLVAGLGVGGIAVALAAQQTIANVFGGVSVVGDHPIRIGEFGKFGDLMGLVEDIGMRSTRIRTLNRTVVSVPNANFAGLNLENYSVRDKMLFNLTFQIKRSTTDDQVHALFEALEKMLAGRPQLEPGPTPARLTGLTSASFNIEIFCYVLTTDINEFYKIQGNLLLAVNEVLKASNVELA